MANIPIWPGSSSFAPGKTPFGFYDDDVDFQEDADKCAKFCATRLGYPMVNIELQDLNFYTALESALTTYGNELYAYKVRDNQLDIEGANISGSLNDAVVYPNFSNIIKLTNQYGTEAGVGGEIPYYSGSIDAFGGVQTYDLKEWAIASASIDLNYGIEIKRVFWQGPSALNRFYDPYSGTGFGTRNMFDAMGFGGMSPAINFMMMPLSYDVQVLNGLEMGDQIRRSNFSFELRDNKLKVFPIPLMSGKIHFEYIKSQDMVSSSIDTNPSGSVTNVSNIPYENPTYSTINSIGRSWIFEYALALSKEMLGYVRGKYNSIPIPNATVDLNDGDLLSAAKEERQFLIEKLRGYFDETSRENLLKRKTEESKYLQTELDNVPMKIYIR